MVDGLSDATVDSFLSLPEDQQRSTLGQMSPQTKQLLLGALQKRTAAPTTPATSTPATPTPPPKSYWVDKFLGPQDPNSFTSRVGQRIEQNVNLIPRLVDQATGQAPTSHAEAEAAKAQVLGPWQGSTLGKVAGALTYGPRLVYNAAKGYLQDPSTLVGDIVTAAPELAEMRPSTAAREAAIPPPPSEAAAPLSAEQQTKYTAALDKANAQYAKESAAHGAFQRQQAIATDLKSGIEGVHQQAQQLYQSHRAALDAGWNELRKVVGTETPTPVRGIVDSINDAETKHLRGSPTQLKQFRDLLTELGMGDYVETEAGRLQPQAMRVTEAPWQTIRTHASAIGRALSTGTLPGNVYQALKQVAGATDEALTSVAESKGYGREYQALKSTERQFRKDFEDLGPIATGEGNPAARVVKAPTPAFASTHILGKAGDILSNTLRRWEPTGRLADEVDRLRGLQEESKSLPKTRTAPPEPTLPPVERPKPEAPKGSPGVRRAVRVAGALGGAAGGAAIGHPWIGMGAGREAASAAYDAYLRRQQAAGGPAIPPPPR